MIVNLAHFQTDNFMKVIKVEVMVSTAEKSLTIPRFIPFDEDKKPTAAKLNTIALESMDYAVEIFNNFDGEMVSPKKAKTAPKKESTKKEAPKKETPKKEAPKKEEKTAEKEVQPAFIYYEKGAKSPTRPVLLKVIEEILGADWKKNPDNLAAARDLATRLVKEKVPVMNPDGSVIPMFKSQVEKYLNELLEQNVDI